MPKYRFAYHVGYRKPKGLGTLGFPDDAAALAAFSELDAQGMAVELWRCDPSKMLAAKDADGVLIAATEAKP